MKFNLLAILCLAIVLKITSCGYDDWYPCQGYEYDVDFGNEKFAFLDQNNMEYIAINKVKDTTTFEINKTTFTPFFFIGGDCDQEVEAFYYEIEDSLTAFKIATLITSGQLAYDEHYEKRNTASLKLIIDNKEIVNIKDEDFYSLDRMKNIAFSKDSGFTLYSDSNIIIKRIQ